MLKENKLPRLNLQTFGLFDEGVEPGGENPILSDESTEGSESVETDEGNPEVLDDDNQAENDPVEPQEKPEPTPEPKDDRPSFDFGDIQSKLDSIMEKMNQPEDVQDEVKEKQEELTEEDIEKMNNEFYMKFTEKPLEALEDLINQRAEEKIQPMKEYFDNMQKMQYWNEQISEFEKEHPDFQDYVDDISKVIQSDESIRNSKNPLELAYKVIKADKLDSKVKELDRPIEERLKEDGVLKELLSNKDIKNMLIKELKSSREETPSVIGKDGKTSVNVEEKPKTISDGTKAWLNS